MAEHSLRWRIAQKVELQWWKNYLRKKTPTDYLAWKKKYWRELLEKIDFQEILYKKNINLLDAGCGPAGIFTVFENAQVTAIDPLLEQYETELSHFSTEKYPNVSFQNIGLEEYKANEKFDAIFCLNAINHVSDINLSFDNLITTARKNADIIVSIDAHNHSFFKHLFRLFQADILHPHQYDLAEYKELLEQKGVKIEKSILIKKAFFFNYYVLCGTKK
ncbi:MAG: class I SAM-dependent methyltransferase [Chitinophagales bacterium]